MTPVIENAANIAYKIFAALARFLSEDETYADAGSSPFPRPDPEASASVKSTADSGELPDISYSNVDGIPCLKSGNGRLVCGSGDSVVVFSEGEELVAASSPFLEAEFGTLELLLSDRGALLGADARNALPASDVTPGRGACALFVGFL